MTDILTDLSTAVLATAVKANLLAFFRYLRRSRRTAFYEDARLIRWHTPIRHPWFNGALSIAPALDNEDAAIQETLAFFTSRNVTNLTWWLEPGLPPAAWGRHLIAHGFRYDNSTPGMAVDLLRLNEEGGAPAELRISTVQDLETLKVWSDIFILGYELPLAWAGDFFTVMVDLGVDLPMRNYIGYLNGHPIATSSLFLAAGVAGIYSVATVPAARGRGIGTAMTLAPLREARAMGYRAGILQSSEMGYRVYTRLGFQRLGEVDHYYWKSAAGQA